VEYKKFDAIVSFSFLNVLHVYILINTTGSIEIAGYFVNELNPGIYTAGSRERGGNTTSHLFSAFNA